MVKISEPMTAITDYILAVETIIFAVLILSTSGIIGQLLWGLAFITTSISAILGGTAHGFKNRFDKKIENIVWKLTVLSIGLGAVLMFSGILMFVMEDYLFRNVILILSAISYIVYAYWMKNHDEFIYVIVYYIPYMLLILIIELFSLDNVGSIWIISGIGLTFLGFGIQAKGLTIHKHFNHNDLFHVIQMVAVFLLYLGVILTFTNH